MAGTLALNGAAIRQQRNAASSMHCDAALQQERELARLRPVACTRRLVFHS